MIFCWHHLIHLPYSPLTCLDSSINIIKFYKDFCIVEEHSRLFWPLSDSHCNLYRIKLFMVQLFELLYVYYTKEL